MTLTRRTLLALTAAFLARPTQPVAAASAPVATLTVAGHGYYDFAKVSLGLDDRLILRREPGNRFDPNAIEILTATGVKLGYVPRRAARDLAPMLDGGQQLVAIVTGRVERDETRKIAHTGLYPGLPVITLTPRLG